MGIREFRNKAGINKKKGKFYNSRNRNDSSAIDLTTEKFSSNHKSSRKQSLQKRLNKRLKNIYCDTSRLPVQRAKNILAHITIADKHEVSFINVSQAITLFANLTKEERDSNAIYDNPFLSNSHLESFPDANDLFTKWCDLTKNTDSNSIIRESANVLWSAGVIGDVSVRAVRHLSKQLLDNISHPDFNAIDLSNSSSGFSRLSEDIRRVDSEIAQNLEERLLSKRKGAITDGSFSPEEAVQIIYRLADENLLDHKTASSYRRNYSDATSSLRIYELVNLSSAFSIFSVRDFKKIKKDIYRSTLRIFEAAPNKRANSFALIHNNLCKSGINTKELLLNVLPEITNSIHEIHPITLAGLISNCGRYKFYNQSDFFKSAAKAISESIECYPDEVLVVFLESCAHVRFRDRKLIRKVASRIKSVNDEIEPHLKKRFHESLKLLKIEDIK